MIHGETNVLGSLVITSQGIEVSFDQRHVHLRQMPWRGRGHVPSSQKNPQPQPLDRDAAWVVEDDVSDHGEKQDD